MEVKYVLKLANGNTDIFHVLKKIIMNITLNLLQSMDRGAKLSATSVLGSNIPTHVGMNLVIAQEGKQNAPWQHKFQCMSGSFLFSIQHHNFMIEMEIEFHLPIEIVVLRLSALRVS